MQLPRDELGRRLRAARENARLLQDDVARELGLTRGSIAQFESGLRQPNITQLHTMASLYGSDVFSFIGESPSGVVRDALPSLFRADPYFATDESLSEAVRMGASVCRELTDLEQLLGISQDRV